MIVQFDYLVSQPRASKQGQIRWAEGNGKMKALRCAADSLPARTRVQESSKQHMDDSVISDDAV